MIGEDDAYTVGLEEPLSHAFSQNGPDAPLHILRVSRSGGLQ